MQKFKVKCNMCKEDHIIKAKEEDIWDWQNGQLIQTALPYLKPGERELLISRTCEGCFSKLFKNDEEEVEEKNITIFRLGQIYADISINGGEIESARLYSNRRYSMEYIIIDGEEIDIEDLEKAENYYVDR